MELKPIKEELKPTKKEVNPTKKEFKGNLNQQKWNSKGMVTHLAQTPSSPSTVA